MVKIQYKAPEEFRKYIKGLLMMELVVFQKELRRFDEDKEYLYMVLNEMGERLKEAKGVKPSGL